MPEREKPRYDELPGTAPAVQTGQTVRELREIDGLPTPHVHNRTCYEDPGPGHGSPFLICNGKDE